MFRRIAAHQTGGSLHQIWSSKLDPDSVEELSNLDSSVSYLSYVHEEIVNEATPSLSTFRRYIRQGHASGRVCEDPVLESGPMLSAVSKVWSMADFEGRGGSTTDPLFLNPDGLSKQGYSQGISDAAGGFGGHGQR
ncbi:hypothetical protein NMY22_g19702 [Coprinellus aureogranulatus]|nr:hypothetical protein NMY22_g19702 [Coprinellus aureogranulatus]